MKLFLLAVFVATSLKYYTLPNIWHLAIGGAPIRSKVEYFQRLNEVGEDFPVDPQVLFTRWSMFPVMLRPATKIVLVANNADDSCTAFVSDPYPTRTYFAPPDVDFNQYLFIITNRHCVRMIVNYSAPPSGLAPFVVGQ